jgi:hypothetical protein
MDLLQYLKELFNIEVNSFMMQQCLREEEYKLNKLKDLNIDRPTLKLKEIPNKPKEFYAKDKLGVLIYFFMFYTIPGSFISAVILGVITGSISVFSVTFIGLIIAIPILAIIGGLFNNRKSYEEKMKEYDSVITYNEKCKKDYEKCQGIYNKKLIYIDQQKNNCMKNMDTIRREITEITNTLNLLYDLDIIYSKYRNLKAISKFLEYVESGRCKTLSGVLGCYNLFEQEYRLDLMLDKFDQVLLKLDDIQKQNINLFTAINRINRNLSEIKQGYTEQYNILGNINEKIGAIEENSNATKCFSEITANNLTQIKNYAEYQDFATRQKRLEEGHY